MHKLTPEIAAKFANLTLGHLQREYPHKLDHVMAGEQDVLAPSVLHPIFYGSYDWHSCVHGWWQVLRIARAFPDLPEAALVSDMADGLLTAENITTERAYLARPESTGFERPYGWAWALALHGELAQHDASWGTDMEGFARDYAERFKSFLPKLTYPLRVGTHFNISFALVLAYDWAVEHDTELAALITERASDWFGNDFACQAWEPGGDEFLSPALCEALLMSRILPQSEFADWFGAFLPDLATGEPATLFMPATVSDRSDGKIAHLDGLNLSRAWCWRSIAKALPAGHPVAAISEQAAVTHLDASLPHVAGDYMGEHWLASFALLALST